MENVGRNCAKPLLPSHLQRLSGKADLFSKMKMLAAKGKENHPPVNLPKPFEAHGNSRLGMAMYAHQKRPYPKLPLCRDVSLTHRHPAKAKPMKKATVDLSYIFPQMAKKPQKSSENNAKPPAPPPEASPEKVSATPSHEWIVLSDSEKE